MDTKLKSSKLSKFIITLIAIMLVAVTSIGMLKSYPKIGELGKVYKYNFFEDYQISNAIASSNYGLYFNILEKNSETEILPSDVLIKKNTYNNYEDSSSYFNETVSRWNRNLKKEYRNLYYVAISTKSGAKESNINQDIKLLSDGSIDMTTFDVNNYQFYIALNFNEDGDMTVKSIYGANEDIVNYRLLDMQENVFYSYDVQLQPIKNMTYIYAVPKEIIDNDFISWGVRNNENKGYIDASAGFIVFASVVIILVGLIIPYRRGRDIIGFKYFAKIPFEIIGAIIGFTIAGIVAFVQFNLADFIRNGGGILTQNTGLTEQNIWLINFLVWFIAFGIFLNFGILIKHIWNYGIVKYFKECSLTGIFIMFILRLIKKAFKLMKRTIDKITEVDLNDDNNKLILKIVLINAGIISLICLVWFFGIIGVIIYSIVIFFVIRKYADEISNKYKILTDATKKIAEGNLDVEIEEDLGLFEPLKDDLERIQQGFKKAVEEEVKSQIMKTELISNVSHDLKTPLTSIITYIDLLKDEKLSQDKRNQYLDTLDKKSQRLQYLIEDLFEMSKASSGNITLNIEKVDVVSLMKQTLLELEDKLEASSLVVRKNLPEHKVILQLDSLRTFRIFENLVLNITKYAMPNTRVYIDIVEKGDFVEIVLKNMAAEEINFDVDQIVERFVRGDESRNTEGSGLGLAIAKSFVELQGGSFNIEVDGDLFKVIIKFNK